ncbi:G-protein coupled receptor 20-like [Petromyzon marinus]|uniref:G-protein coupled receptor 20-like n=1 Tax=Petromyzon marinus TaxID=7757 RepID=UPI003F730B20
MGIHSESPPSNASWLAAPPGARANSTALIKRPYMHKLAHLDEELFDEYHALWLTLLAVSVVVSLAGLAANSAALWVFSCRTRSKTAPVIYTLNLVAADLLLSLAIPARVLMYASRGRCLACSHAHVFVYFVNMYASVFFLTCIGVDRYMAIVHPLASKRWRRPLFAVALSAVLWTLATVITTSVLTMAIKFSACCYFKLFMLSLFEFFLPFAVTAFVTARMLCALRRGGGVGGSAGSREKLRRAVRLLAAVFVVFAVCFVPFHVRQVVLFGHDAVDESTALVAYHVTLTLSSFNCVLDPVVYCFVTKRSRAALRSLFARGPKRGGASAATVEKDAAQGTVAGEATGVTATDVSRGQATSETDM